MPSMMTHPLHAALFAMLLSSVLRTTTARAAPAFGRAGAGPYAAFAGRSPSSFVRRSAAASVVARSSRLGGALSEAGDAGRFPSRFASRNLRSPARVGGLPSLSASSATAADTSETEADAAVPITLLAGFLGSGKTSALKNFLENSEGIRVGVIVNDVAAVNIDAKLISNPGNDGSKDDDATSGVVVAENGGTIELQNGCACCSLADELLTSIQNLLEGREFDAVVVELSGVADPVAVQQNWKQAKLMQHPATKVADVKRVVTVVDSSTFGTDWMTWDSAGERDNWSEGDDCAGERIVPELLAEQVEAADLLLINKIDLAGPEQVKVASSVAKGLNEKAGLFEVEFGKIETSEILGKGSAAEKKEEEEEVGHDHSHDHNACEDPACTDPSHDHSHSHDVAAHADHNDTDEGHSHSHSHDHDAAASSDPDGADTGHSHFHDHLGISNFVYKATAPFDTLRLLGLLDNWPVPIKDDLDIGQLQQAIEEGIEMDGVVEKSPFIGVLRSKGFCWMAPSQWTGPNPDIWRHDTAMYWSHAGKHFGITTAGKWWGCISKEQMKQYFVGNMKEYERILKEDWASEEWGDRRQELVFIGTGLDEKAITDALNKCLLTEEELNAYRQKVRNVVDTTFTSP